MATKNKLTVGGESWPLEEVMIKISDRIKIMGVPEDMKNQMMAAALMIFMDGIGEGMTRERGKWQEVEAAAERVAAELRQFRNQMLLYVPSKGKA